uniref:methenyltetrahydrofolate cyclohydrolase n=1 Tax=Acrobeloides nanus TaxID=290746 RepID=A0A914CU79_9BILA
MALGLKNSIVPCTPKGIISILQRYDRELFGKHTVVVGKSNIVGKPLANLIMEKTHSTITICHKETKNLQEFTKQADVLIVAAGVPNLITEDMVKPGSIVIDVGITRIEDQTKKSGFRLVGDVDFENVKKNVSLITPVPGGVGPLTVASLISNTLEAFTNQNQRLIEETTQKSQKAIP